MTPSRHAALRAHPIPPAHPATLKLFPSDPDVCRRLEEWMLEAMPAYAHKENKAASVQFTGKPTDSMSGEERKRCMTTRQSLIMSAIKIMNGAATSINLSHQLRLPNASVHRTITDLMIAGKIEAINPASKPIYYREKTPDR
jgi:hypothetical protein